MVKHKTKLFTVVGISTALLVGAGTTYAAQMEKNESVKTELSIKQNKIVKTPVKAPTSKEIQSVLKSKPTPSNMKVEGFFSTNGQPDYTADYFLNDEKLFSILKLNAQELKQELATGKTVVEIATAKNVSKQQVIDTIANTQAQIQVGNNEDQMEQMKKNIEPKVVHVIEHKTETPWKK
ncbi:putative DNA-binding protein YlxM (UPF0122 family) [Bacillus sp. OAE603]